MAEGVVSVVTPGTEDVTTRLEVATQRAPLLKVTQKDKRLTYHLTSPQIMADTSSSDYVQTIIPGSQLHKHVWISTCCLSQAEVRDTYCHQGPGCSAYSWCYHVV